MAGIPGKTMDLDVTPNTTVAEVKKFISDTCGGPVGARLVFCGRQLAVDSRTLAEEKVGDQAEVRFTGDQLLD